MDPQLQTKITSYWNIAADNIFEIEMFWVQDSTVNAVCRGDDRNIIQSPITLLLGVIIMQLVDKYLNYKRLN